MFTSQLLVTCERGGHLCSHLKSLLFVLFPQLPYHELEKLNGIEEVKQYLHKKLLDVPL